MTLKEQRIKRLLKDGFLPAEARLYASSPISTQGMKSLRRLRSKYYKDSLKAGISKGQFKNIVHNQYSSSGLVDNKGHIKPVDMHDLNFNRLLKPSQEREYLSWEEINTRGRLYDKLSKMNISRQWITEMVYPTFVDKENMLRYEPVDYLACAMGLKPIPREWDTEQRENIKIWAGFIDKVNKDATGIVNRAIQEGYSPAMARQVVFRELNMLRVREMWKRFREEYPKRKHRKLKNPFMS